MTSLAPAPLIEPRDRLRGRRLVVGYLAVLGTLPYLALKAIWLAGGTLGLTDLAFAGDTSVVVLNGVTAGLDVVAIAVALAFTHDWGQRIPAWLVLLPIWVGTGLLTPITIGLPIVGVDLASSGSGMAFLQPWVQPVVYSGFAVQGIALTVAFVLYAKVRWPEVFTTRLADLPRGATHPVQVVLADGAALLTAGVAALNLVNACGASIGYPAAAAAQRDLADRLVEGIHGGLAALAAVGVLWAVHRRRPTTPTWVPVTLAWLGAGAMFGWGLWTVVNQLGATALARGADPAPLLHLHGLAKLLAGLVIALTGLLFLAEQRATRA
jgi:hypothetical protein